MSNELKAVLDDASIADAAIETPPVPPSETVTTADRWTRRVGNRLAESWRELGVTGAADGDAPVVAADAFETLMSPAPMLAENPADTHRAQWWRQLLESPELGALRAQTVLAPAIAEIAAAALAQQWGAYDVQNPEPEQQPDGDGQQDGDARMRSTRAAVDAAQSAADEAQGIAAGLGVGTESHLDAARLAGYARRLKQSGNLARIMQLAGRFVAKAAALQKQRTDLPGLEVTGVELSGDVARILPLEAAYVAGAVPEMETLALYRLTTRQTLSYRRDRREPVGMGPIVVSVDESGSMAGEKIATAKALALGMASVARLQRRPFLLASFAGTPNVRTSSDNPDDVVAWCSTMLGGGTVLDGPLATIPRDHWPAGKVGARADHIIITDSEVIAPDALVAQYREWATKRGVRTFVIGVQAMKHAIESLRPIADGGMWNVAQLDLDSLAVETVLSIPGPTAGR
jgi:uncharacterized protein with von Willebrand factor type A (vWA) domain